MDRDVRTLTLLALLSCVVLLADATGALGSLVLYFLPLAVLLLPLLAGRYVGEEKIGQLRSRITGRDSRRERTSSAPVTDRGVAAFLPRGGRLLGRSLAVRPPPAASLA